MKICNHCKTENKDNASFCRHCGFAFAGAAEHNSGLSDSRLLDKVNDLQQKITESENKLNSARNEVLVLRSQVTSLESHNSSIQSKLTQAERKLQDATKDDTNLRDSLNSAYLALDAEKQKTKAAENKAEQALKEKEEAKSSNGTTHVWYWLIIVVCIITAIVQCQQKNELSSQGYNIDQLEKDITNRNLVIASLQNENVALKKENATLSSQLRSICKGKDIIVNQIDVKNAGENYNGIILSSSTTYINPRIELYSLIEGSTDLYIKFFAPYGLTTGTTSPSGYSYKSNVYLNKNQVNTIELSGWGSDTKGNWNSGDYRIEIYYKNTCIGTKQFKIY